MRTIFKIIILLPVISFTLLCQVNREWVRRYNGTANSFDLSAKLMLDHGGNIIIAGSTTRTSSSTDILALKYNGAGSQLWSAVYNGPGNASENAYGSCLDSGGSCYITGFATDSALINRLVTLKISSAGSIIWTSILNSASYTQSFGRECIVSPAGEIFVTGSARNISGFYDIATIKYSPSGTVLAQAFYNGISGNDDYGYSLCTDNQGNVYVLGVTRQQGEDKAVIIKYNSNLVQLSAAVFSGTGAGDDKAVKILFYNNALYICLSFHNSGSGHDYTMIKQSLSGGQVWLVNFNGSGNHQDLAYDMFVQNDYILVTGSSRNADTLGSEDFATLKIDTAGSLLWSRVFNGPAGGIDYGASVAADTEGSVYAGGASDLHENHLNFALIKYSSSGDFKWFETYSAQYRSEDFISTVAVDNSFNVYLTGISFDSTTDYDIATIKYSQPIGIVKISGEIPQLFSLSRNYPNPFNPKTLIRFSIGIPSGQLPKGRAVKSFAELKVYDAAGREIETLVSSELSPGTYEVTWDGMNFASGVYYYRLQAGGFIDTRKMILLK